MLPALLRREDQMGTVVVDTLNVNLAVNPRGMSNWEGLAGGQYRDDGSRGRPRKVA